MSPIDTLAPMIANPLMAVLVPAVAAGIASRIRTRATTRRDLKELKEDLDLLANVAPDFSASRHLRASIEDRLINYSYRNLINSALRTIRWIALSIAGIFSFQMALIIATKDAYYVRTATLYFVIDVAAIVCVEVVAIASLRWDIRATNKRRALYFLSDHYPNRFDTKEEMPSPATSGTHPLVAKRLLWPPFVGATFTMPLLQNRVSRRTVLYGQNETTESASQDDSGGSGRHRSQRWRLINRVPVPAATSLGAGSGIRPQRPVR